MIEIDYEPTVGETAAADEWTAARIVSLGMELTGDQLVASYHQAFYAGIHWERASVAARRPVGVALWRRRQAETAAEVVAADDYRQALGGAGGEDGTIPYFTPLRLGKAFLDGIAWHKQRLSLQQHARNNPVDIAQQD